MGTEPVEVRRNVLFIRLTEAERRQINALAAVEKLPAATLDQREHPRKNLRF